MADLKTTQERRDRFRTWKFGDDHEVRFSPLDEALAALEAP